MPETPKVGLVMAAYNATAYLENAVKTIFNQEFTDFVCSIVDDGSTDGTAELARELTNDDQRFVVESIEHGGQSVARNFGASRQPKTDFLCFPDSDDDWRPDALSSLLAVADTFSGVGAHGLANSIEADGTPFEGARFTEYGRDRFILRHLKKQPIPLDEPSTFASLLWSCTVYPPGVWIIRRDVFEDVIGFDPKLRHFEDWDLQIRAARQGDFCFVDKVVVDYRHHAGQISSDPRGAEAITMIRNKTARSNLNTTSQRRLANFVWRAHELQNALRSMKLIAKEPKSAAKNLRLFISHVFHSLVGPNLTRNVE